MEREVRALTVVWKACCSHLIPGELNGKATEGHFLAVDKEERKKENTFKIDIFLNDCLFELLLEAGSTARGGSFPGVCFET